MGNKEVKTPEVSGAKVTYKPGMRVRWGHPNDAKVGTLIELTKDEDTGELAFCGAPELHDDIDGALWTIRFDNGVTKKCCCEFSIRGIIK